MASGPFPSWQIEREKVEAVTDSVFLGSKSTAAMKLKDPWLLRRQAMTNLDSLLKSRDITLMTKVCIAKAMVFLVVMYRCES